MNIPVRQHKLGFDAGFRNAGAVVFTASGRPVHSVVFQTKPAKGVKVWEQNYCYCVSHFAWLSQLCREWNISHVAVELQTGSSKSQKALRAMSLSFAATVTAFTALNLTILPVEPLEVKRLTSTTGDKNEIIAWANADPALAKLLTGVKGKDEHLADAMAVAAVRGIYDYAG